MADNLIFYTNPQSRGRIIRWMLEETGAEYQTEVLEYGTTMKGADYLAINPMGKVPAIRHGDQTVTEAAAICAYLADVFPSAKLAPEPAKRADYYRWMFFCAGPVEAAITNRSMSFDVPADKQGMVGYGSYDKVMSTLEHAVTDREYIVGQAFSAADVLIGSQIGFGLAFKSIPEKPAFIEYFNRLSQRDAYKRATKLDDALIAKS